MREIKFRAFVDDDIIEGWPAVMHPVEQMRWGEDDELEAVHLLPCGWIDIKWIKVLQYTGLKDKNGKEIYEGDILELKADEPGFGDIEWQGIVKFGNPNGGYDWGFQIKPIGDESVNPLILLWVETEMPDVSCKVIGNIYQNPELLEGENELVLEYGCRYLNFEFECEKGLLISGKCPNNCIYYDDGSR